jgi:hypothetical protein
MPAGHVTATPSNNVGEVKACNGNVIDTFVDITKQRNELNVKLQGREFNSIIV